VSAETGNPDLAEAIQSLADAARELSAQLRIANKFDTVRMIRDERMNMGEAADLISKVWES
jgi:hypothetical protein